MNPGLLGGIALGGALLFSLLGLALAALAWYGWDWRALEASRFSSKRMMPRYNHASVTPG